MSSIAANFWNASRKPTVQQLFAQAEPLSVEALLDSDNCLGEVRRMNPAVLGFLQHD